MKSNDLLPAGNYKCSIVEVLPMTSRMGSNVLRFELKILPRRPGSSRKLYRYYALRTAEGKQIDYQVAQLSKLLAEFGINLLHHNRKYLELTSLEGKEVIAKVIIRELPPNEAGVKRLVNDVVVLTRSR